MATSDEAQVREAAASYVAAFNRGDAKTVADHWSDNGEWISPGGERVQGRAAIAKAMTAFFAEQKGVQLEIHDFRVRFLTPDVALEEGTARVVASKTLPSDSTYVAVHVKRQGKWLLESVRETEAREHSDTPEKLRELSWLLGDWIDQGKDSTIENSVKWSKNKSFLVCQFRVHVPDMEELEGTQIIGYDPSTDSVRSWMFDEDGGFGSGVWTRKENRWIVKFAQVLPDGRTATATNIFQYLEPNRYTWQSVGRKVQDQFVPNIKEVVVVRKQSTPSGTSGQK